jgi:succinyl-CoA synthetase beta subunit
MVREAGAREAPNDYAPLALDVNTRRSEHGAKILLSQAGMRVPLGELTLDGHSAVAAAARIGYPVILKVVSEQILHKSDVGGVVVVADAEGLESAYADMLARIVVTCPDAVIDGVLVEEIVEGGVEVIVGARRDVNWGETVLVGLGGVWAESFDDAVVISADADRSEILTAIDSLRGAATLRGARGTMKSDVDALVRAVELLGGVLRSTPTCVEIEVNPLVVLSDGQGVVALDALIVAHP